MYPTNFKKCSVEKKLNPKYTFQVNLSDISGFFAYTKSFGVC